MHAATADVERIDLDATSPWWAEHRARYHYASSYVAGRDVLDIACGTGLGASVLMAAGAQRLVGMEISSDAIAQAGRVRLAGFHPCQADGTRLPAAAGSFGVITSFETIEHVDDDARFVRELARVLTPDGVALISTPNALHTKPVDGVPANPFHVREYTPAELTTRLQDGFGDVVLLGQRPARTHRPCPYWESAEAQQAGPNARLVAASWKLHGRLPAVVRDRSWRLLHRRSYYPGEHDFEFGQDAVRHGHVLLAVCRQPRHGA